MRLAIEGFSNEVRFPRHPQTAPWLLMPFRSMPVRLGAHDQHKVGAVDLPLHPQWPAFGRMRVVLIDHCVDAIRPKLVRQSANACSMLLRFVAVADEDSFGADCIRINFNGHISPLCQVWTCAFSKIVVAISQQ